MTLLPRIGWDTKLGSLNAFYGIDRNLRSRDRVVTPAESLSRVIREASAGGLDPDGVRICLAPGRYFMRGETTMDVAINNVHIYAAVPGQSIIVRSDDSVIRGVFTISGSDCSIRGIAFEDTNPSPTGVTGRGFTVSATGDRFTLSDCLFTSCKQAIAVSGNNASIRNNRIVAVDDNTLAISIFDSASFASVHGNIIEDATLTNSIFAGNNVSKSSFVGNVCAASSAISYKNGQDNVNAGNVGTVTER